MKKEQLKQKDLKQEQLKQEELREEELKQEQQMAGNEQDKLRTKKPDGKSAQMRRDTVAACSLHNLRLPPLSLWLNSGPASSYRWH